MGDISALPADIQNKIRTAVKKYLKANGLTELDLASAMGLKEQTVRNYLATTDITPKTVRKISEALSYPYALLIEGEFYLGKSRLEELEQRIKKIEDFLWPDKS